MRYALCWVASLVFDVGAVLEEVTGHVEVGAVRGRHQRRPAPVVGRGHVGPGVHEAADLVEATLLGRLDQRQLRGGGSSAPSLAVGAHPAASVAAITATATARRIPPANHTGRGGGSGRRRP